MKIAMIGAKRVPSREGGIEIVVEELSVHMAEMGHEVHCYNRWDDLEAKHPTEYKGIRLIDVPTLPSPTFHALVYSVLATVRAAFGGYDVIHIHAEGPAAMSFLPRLLGIPVVVTIHGLDWQRGKWGGLATKYLKFGERQAVRFADSLIVLSKNMQDYFMQMYGRGTVYLNNGVSPCPARGTELIQKKWGLEKDGYILFLARITTEKGLHYLIEAYKQLNTDKRLIIAGKLTDTEYVRQVQAMAADDSRITFVDYVTGQTMEELMSNAFLYVLPSELEGMSMSLLEALSYGTRCLVSDIKENTEAAREYACYFQTQNVEDLRRKLEQILSGEISFDPEAQKAFIKRSYDWGHVAGETLRLYETAIRRKGAEVAPHDSRV